MAKTKALISFAVTAKLICVFVFAFAKSRFSHDAGHFILVVTRQYNNQTDSFVTSHPTAAGNFYQQLVVRHNDTEIVVTLILASDLDTSVEQAQTLSDPQISINKPNRDLVAPVNEPFTTFFLVNGNTSGYQFQARAMFQGLNQSDDYLVRRYFFARSHSAYLNISWMNISHSQWNVSVEIDNTYSRFGGILSIIMIVRPSVYNLQRSFVYDTVYRKDYEILSNVTSTLVAVQPDWWAQRSIPNMTWIKPPYLTIPCLAMGNPRPDEVVLSKVTEQGYTDVKTLLYEFRGNYIVEKMYRLSADEPGVEGTYVCR